jgi:hypothetical protein
MRFKVSGLTLRSLMHFGLTLIQGDKHESNFNVLQVDLQISVFPETFVEEPIFSPLYIFGAFVQN